MISFLCPRDGTKGSKDLVVISLPDECCGKPTILGRSVSLGGRNTLIKPCTTHMSTYKTLWDNFHNKIAEVKFDPSIHVTCGKCNTKNEYAIPNQSDGSFICYGCRSR